MQYCAPAFWIVSVSLAVLTYIQDVRSVAWEIVPLQAFCFELGVPLSLGLFFFTALSDPGKVPAGIKSASGVEEFMRFLETATVVDGDKLVDANGRRLSFSRLCTTTFILKGLRTKYCVSTGACVEEFDHFCGWLNCAIGRGNHRPFIMLAIAECCTQICHLWCLVHVAFRLVAYERIGQWLWALVTSYPLMSIMIVVQGFTSPGIALLACTQMRMIAVNLTTNEMMNCKRYEHFWEYRGQDGAKRQVFVNPFHKGGVSSNCLDFWWTRRRGEEGPSACL